MAIGGGIGRQAKTALSKIGRQAKFPTGLCSKLTTVVILGMCFIFVWSFFSSTPDSLTSQRESFSDIAEPVTAAAKNSNQRPISHHSSHQSGGSSSKPVAHKDHSKKPNSKKKKHHITVIGNDSLNVSSSGNGSFSLSTERSENEVVEKSTDDDDNSDSIEQGEELVVEVDGANEEVEGEREDQEVEDEEKGKKKGKNKKLGPLFDPKAHYSWRLCSARSKHNYIPCIDIESPTGKIQRYRHRERSCPRPPPMCLVPLPPNGYGTLVPWPESKRKVLYKNVAHPKLAAYVKSWIMESEDYLMFPLNQSNIVGGVAHYLESIEEMVPDVEWGNNVRVVLDIGVTDSSFAASLIDKDVVNLSLGLKDDLVDLAQIALERGFPAIVSPFASKRLPFPSGVFDAIHCCGCNIHWHSRAGRLLLELNRILRPGGYFILSEKHGSIEEEEAMTLLTASICWNVLADKTDEVSEVGIKIYQKPESNGIYELRRKKNPPLCKENENADATWNVLIRRCLHLIPTAIEERGTEWPAEWPKRLEAYPDWLADKENVKADTQHWKDIIEKSYLTGMGIDWGKIRNVMDMKAIYGGFAAALSQHKVWVMSVVSVHAPNTLPFSFERGLFGVYHDWCECFGTYPRSYDLLHADHLLSRLKNRCNQPVAIVVEMDRVLRPGGWVIVRDKMVILEPLEGIFRSLNWDIRMIFAQEKEGILVAQKTTWRP